MLRPEFSAQFKKDYQQAIGRGCDAVRLEKIITALCASRPLPAHHRDHALINSRKYVDVRECHIQPDWLLIYKIEEDTSILKLIRTGSHSDLFG